MIKRFHLKITGKVQGVWYRASTQRKAQELGLSGWVRNLPDGSVEAAIEGPEGKLQLMMQWCAQGPTHARVEAVVPKEIAVEKSQTFEIV